MPDDATFRAVNYRSADGRLELFARVYSAKADGNSELPLLMMHGLTRNSADFSPLIEALGNQRTIIVPDQRGRGHSAYDPDPINYRPDVYVADIWALLAELNTQRVICIGTSMGGLMSMLMGAQQPTKVAGIVLNDIGPEVSAAGLSRIRSYVGESKDMADLREAAEQCAAINGDAFDGFGTADWIAFAQRTCRELPNGKIAFAYDPAISEGMGEQEQSAVPPDLWPIWDSLTEIPVLVIRGAKSDILTSDTVAQMAERHGPTFDNVDIEGRGHAPLLNETPAVTSIRAFCETIGANSPE